MGKHIKYFETALDASIALQNGELESPYVVGLADGTVLYDGEVGPVDIEATFETSMSSATTAAWTGETLGVSIRNNTSANILADCDAFEAPVSIEPYSWGYTSINSNANPSKSAATETYTVNYSIVPENTRKSRSVADPTPILSQTLVVSADPASYAAFVTVTSTGTTEVPETITIQNDYNAPKDMWVDGVYYSGTPYYTAVEPGVHNAVVNLGSSDASNQFAYTAIDSIELTPDVTTLSANGLRSTKVKSVEFPYVETLGNSTFQGCTNLTDVTFSDNLQNIGYNTFRDCTSLTYVNWNGAEIPDIETGDFRGCSSLTSIKFPDTVTEIKSNASYQTCQNCSNLIEVEFGTGLTNMGDYMFATGCVNLTTLVFNTVEAPTFGENTFGSGDSVPFYGGTIIVPSGATENYSAFTQTLVGWSIVEQGVTPEIHIKETFVTTTSNQTLNVPSGSGSDGRYYNRAILDDQRVVLVSAGTFTFAEPGEHTLEYIRQSQDTYLQGWFMNSDAVSVSGNCYSNGSEYEWGCHGNDYYQQETSMTFANNPNLTSVFFGGNFVKIGSSCFSGDTALTSISIASSAVTNDGNYPFDTIVNQEGTLHIPEDSRTGYTQMIANLGNNWNVDEPFNPDNKTLMFVQYMATTGVPVKVFNGPIISDIVAVYYNGEDVRNQIDENGYFTFTVENNSDLSFYYDGNGMITDSFSGLPITHVTITGGTAVSEYNFSVFHQQFTNCTELVSVSFGDKFGRLNYQAFSGCTSLQLMSIYADSGFLVYSGSPMVTISENNGTLRVPSGSDFSSWAETNLGENWTVEDSL